MRKRKKRNPALTDGPGRGAKKQKRRDKRQKSNLVRSKRSSQTVAAPPQPSAAKPQDPPPVQLLGPAPFAAAPVGIRFGRNLNLHRPETVGMIRISARTALLVSLGHANGRPCADLRFHTLEGETSRPAMHGISFPVIRLCDLISILHRLEDAAVTHGWLPAKPPES
jgi:hypothetical protein